MPETPMWGNSRLLAWAYKGCYNQKSGKVGHGYGNENSNFGIEEAAALVTG
ncbi:hypothetical protein MM59RIKEN_16230 [Pusillibacter faecalis]|uniref:Uncharacterized protein n=1 Tax=Pusillibacter faecalis TaxID=2714358 RepID=A0A810Q8K4_9FIRM|nr:hypothetical protein MM59RIKEN_16230 [Pusillibacter faecalis]